TGTDYSRARFVAPCLIGNRIAVHRVSSVSPLLLGEGQHLRSDSVCHRVDGAKRYQFKCSSRPRANTGLAHRGPHNLERTSLQLARNALITRALTSRSSRSSLEMLGLQG